MQNHPTGLPMLKFFQSIIHRLLNSGEKFWERALAITKDVFGKTNDRSNCESTQQLTEAPSQNDIHEDGNIREIITKWAVGDWDGLTDMDLDLLGRQDNRIKLSLYSAEAMFKLGEKNRARQMIKLAEEKGCTREQISRVLISNVYHTLARASKISGRSEHAALNIQKAEVIKKLNRDTIESPIFDEIERYNKRFNNDSKVNDSRLELPFNSGTGKILEMDQEENKLSDDKFFEKFSSLLKRECNNVIKQMEAYMKIQSFLQDAPITPTMHGWPISADFAVYLIKLVSQKHYDLIVEFGSGTSTVLMAQALAKRQAKASSSYQIAFEHEEKFCKQTTMLLNDANISLTAVHISANKLENYTDETGDYLFYNTSSLLSSLPPKFTDKKLNVFVLVDGPPEAIGKNCRYPALPVIAEYFRNADIDVLLDDYNRVSERETAILWRQFLDKAGRHYTEKDLPLEKGAFLIEIAAEKYEKP